MHFVNIQQFIETKSMMKMIEASIWIINDQTAVQYISLWKRYNLNKISSIYQCYDFLVVHVLV